MSISFQQKIFNIGIILAIAILGSSGIFAYLQNKNTQAASKLVEHTHIVKYTALQLQNFLVLADININNYLLTKDYTNIPIAHDYFKKTQNILKLLKKLTEDNPIQQANITNLENIINQRIKIANTTLQLLDQKG